MPDTKRVRSAAKAVIIQDGKILLLKKKDDKGYFYTLPGGGQEYGETISEALVRECLEEVSLKVKPERILFIRDYIGVNHEIKKDIEACHHQFELMFLCSIAEGAPSNGNAPDSGQISIDWVELANIEECRLYPAVIKKYLTNIEGIKDVIRFGDVN